MIAESRFLFSSKNATTRYSHSPYPLEARTAHQRAGNPPAFRLAGLSYRPSELISYLRGHSARAQRSARPFCQTVLECYKPCGGQAVEINFAAGNQSKQAEG